MSGEHHGGRVRGAWYRLAILGERAVTIDGELCEDAALLPAHDQRAAVTGG